MDYYEDWQSYISNVNSARSSVFVDLGFAPISPISGASLLSWLWIKLREAREDGLSSDSEFADLCSYEDELNFLISESQDIYYVGRITGSGRREFYFYSNDNVDLRERLKPLLAAHPEYRFQLGSKPDDAWSQYHSVLYPGPRGLEQIRARAEAEIDRTSEK